MTALAHKQDVPVARAIWIEEPCEACDGTGSVGHCDRLGFVDLRCEDCDGEGYHDTTLDCEFCDTPTDATGFCLSCDEFAAGYGQKVVVR